MWPSWSFDAGTAERLFAPGATDWDISSTIAPILVEHFKSGIFEDSEGSVTIASTHVQFTCSFSLLLLSEQHATKACSSIFTIPHA